MVILLLSLLIKREEVQKNKILNESLQDQYNNNQQHFQLKTHQMISLLLQESCVDHQIKSKYIIRNLNCQ